MQRSKRLCKWLKVAAASVLAGCAMTPERAAQMSDSQLCYWRIATKTMEKQRLYEAELASRKTVCTPDMVRLEHERQASQREYDRRAWQDVGNALQQPMMPRALTCTTTTYGGQATTTCR
jgi:hypothetical protein